MHQKFFVIKSNFKKAKKKPFLEPNVKWKNVNDWMIVGTGI